MRYAGVDIASERHVVVVVDGDGTVLRKASPFGEDAEGYSLLRERLGPAGEVLVALEATGHYWKNLVGFLLAEGYTVALLNPLRTKRFGQEDLVRAKNDNVDAMLIARFAAQKRLGGTRLPDEATEELREMVRLRDRLVQDLGDRVRQLHRLVDLGFPEFTRHVKSLDSQLACSILKEYPTAKAFVGLKPNVLSRLCYDGRHRVGPELAQALIATAAVSVGRHHGEAYRTQVLYVCDDINTLRTRIRETEANIEKKLDEHDVGSLLTTIDGIGPQTAARLIAELGNPAEFKSSAALASYLGVAPATNQSGKRQSQRAGITNIGNARLRSALWMPTLTAVRRNPWLKAYYERLRSRGKVAKVALVAAMHKLLSAIYAVARDRKPFTPHLVPEIAPPTT